MLRYLVACGLSHARIEICGGCLLRARPSWVGRGLEPGTGARGGAQGRGVAPGLRVGRGLEQVELIRRPVLWVAPGLEAGRGLESGKRKGIGISRRPFSVLAVFPVSG